MDGKHTISVNQVTLDEIVRRILSVASPEKIILFGFAATSTMTANSEVHPLLKSFRDNMGDFMVCLA